jgi:hypothetical protein
MVLVQSNGKPGRVTLIAKSNGLKEAKLILSTEPHEARPAVP